MNENYTKDFFLGLAKGQILSDKFTRINQNGVTNILEVSFVDYGREYNRNISTTLIGFAIEGINHFYGIDYGYRDIDINLHEAVKQNEQLLENLYQQRISEYNIDNLVPVTDKALTKNKYGRPFDVESDLEDFRNNCLNEYSRDKFFGIKRKSHEPDTITHEEVMRYIACQIDDSVVNDIVEQRIAVNANMINLHIREDALADEVVKQLSQDNSYVVAKKIYDIVNAIDTDKMKSVKVSFEINGKIFDKLPVKTAVLPSSMVRRKIGDYEFTDSIQNEIEKAWGDTDYRDRNIRPELITSITYGKSVLYSR